MNFTVKNIGVDSGTIMVADMDYLDVVPSPDAEEIRQCGKIFEVPNGQYNVSYVLPADYDNEEEIICEGEGKLTVTSGKIFVCDPCYCIGRVNNEWDKYLNDTDCLDNLNTDKAFIIDKMGGDGEYEVILTLEKI